MKEKLLNLKVPKIYKENLFIYEEGLDNAPEWIYAQKLGWSREEYSKLQKLIEIEYMKYLLNDEINDNKITEDEIKQANELIENAIIEYNEM